MKREHIIINNDGWDIIVDAPFNNDVLDYSGNNNNLTIVSGTPSYITVNGSVWANFRNTNTQLQTPQQSTYINNFKLEIDFYRIGSSPTICQIVEGFALAGQQAIKIGSNWGTYLAIGIEQPNHSEHDEYTWGIYPRWTQIPLNKPIRTIVENYNNVITSEIYNIENEANPQLIQSGQMATPTFSSASNETLKFGVSTYSPASRYFNGYLRRFKLYTK